MSLLRPFIAGSLSSIAAIIVAQRFFPEHVAMATCAFISIGLGAFIAELVDFNRRAIWDGEMLPKVANRKLALELTVVFFGIFLTYLALQILINPKSEIDISAIYQFSFYPLLKHNLQVLSASLLLTFIYRSNGLILVLSWNAINWASGIGDYLNSSLVHSDLSSTLLLGLALMPHLTLEAIGYTIGGMAALFLSKAVTKYRFLSPEFHRVSRACLVLLCLSIVALVLACYSEIFVGQPIFHALIRR